MTEVSLDSQWNRSPLPHNSLQRMARSPDGLMVTEMFHGCKAGGHFVLTQELLAIPGQSLGIAG